MSAFVQCFVRRFRPHLIQAPLRRDRTGSRYLWWLAVLLCWHVVAPARAGNLTNVSVTLGTDIAGHPGIYTVAFTPASGLANNDKIVITFPAGFDLAGVTVAAGAANLTGGLLVSKSGQELTLTRDGTGTALPPNTPTSVLFGSVTNHKTAGTYALPAVQTFTHAGAPKDGPGVSASFTIVAGPLDRFTLTPNLGVQTAGKSFSFTITARDANGNEKAVSGQVKLSDPSGTLTPTGVNFSNQSQRTVNSAVIARAQTRAMITASLDNKIGQSNGFAVNPGSLSKFALTPISSPQASGVPFPVTMTALDANDNVVTSFSGGGNVVTISSNTGSVMPATSQPFAGGVRTEFITFGDIGSGTAVLMVQNGGRSGNSNAFTVKPGEPAGEIALQATPAAIPANGVATTTIVSLAPLRDAHGNLVGAGKLLTVAVSDTSLGTIVTPDADPGTPNSLQVMTDAQSHITLAFRAKTTGGSAAIQVSGGNNGSAQGNATVSVNELRILRIQAERDTVSVDQHDVPVIMVVQNAGRDPIQLIHADLRFSGSPGWYQVKRESPTFPATIPGQFQTLTLRFRVHVDTDALSGYYSIDGVAEGTVATVGDVSDNAADETDQWLVQTAPNLFYLPNSLKPTVVSVGSYYQFSIRVRNTGEAHLLLDPDRTRFRLQAFGTTFSAFLDANAVRVVAQGDTTISFRPEQIPRDFPRESFDPRIEIVGTHNGAPFSVDTLRVNAVTVKDGAPLEIVNVNTSQDTVTQGMDREWMITLEVRNNSSSAMRLDSTDMKIVIAGQQDTFYEIDKPSAFATGFDTLGANNTGFLEFKVKRTGAITGAASVVAYVKTTAEGSSFEALTIGTQGSFLVQSQAALQIELVPSQPFVTQNQIRDWTLNMRVTNTGGSDVEVLFAGAPPTLSFEKPSGYSVIVPSRLNGSPASVIKAGATREMTFVVENTGPDLGPNQIHGTIDAREINSNRLLSAATESSGGGASVTVQTPARVSIDSTWLAGVFNGDSVNTNQPFQVKVRLRRAGEESIDSVWVSLESDGSSRLERKVVAVPANEDIAIFPVVAAAEPTVRETFIATLDSTLASNTKGPAQVDPARDNEAYIFIDKPGRLQLRALLTSLRADTVTALQTEDWFVYVVLEAEGNASHVLLDSAKALGLTVGGLPRTDYEITRPVALQGGGLLLRSGLVDTLVYRVLNTGRDGGTLVITAKVTGRDFNDRRALEVVGTKQVQVLSQTVVSIVNTRFAPPVNQSGDMGAVNTGQEFVVNAEVQNLGFEPVEWAAVSLRKTDGSAGATVLVAQDTIRGIENQDVGTARFRISAGELPSAGSDAEVFTAQIDSARTPGTTAKIGPPLGDTSVRARIQRPAKLELSLSTDKPGHQLTVGQSFQLRATVSNLGDADFDNSGLLQIVPPLPAGYQIANNTPRPFTAGSVVTWQAVAPASPSQQDEFHARFVHLPLDRNDGLPVRVADTTAVLPVSVHESLLSVLRAVIQEPQGATDSVVSTEQTFVVKAWINKSPNLMVTRARFRPASGYRLAEGELEEKNVSGDSVSWNVRAPSTPDDVPAALKILATGEDTGGRPVPPDSMTLPVRTEARASLVLVPTIFDPPGATGGILSLGQGFQIRAELNNGGTATTYGDARVQLDLGNSGITVQGPLEQVLTIPPGTYRGAVEWQAQAPDTLSLNKQLAFTVSRLPKDVNTNADASIQLRTVKLDVSTQERGHAALAGLRVFGPEGAKDGVLSSEQEFTLSADLSWTRAAAINARLILPAGGFVPEPLDDELEREFDDLNGSRTLFWKVKVPVQPVARAVFKVELNATDASNHEFNLGPLVDSLALQFVRRSDLVFRAEVSNPPAARDHVVSVQQLFEVSAILENLGQAQPVGADSIHLTLPEGYSLDRRRDSLLVKSSVPVGSQRRASWWVRAPKTKSKNPTGETLTLRLQQTALDENTNESARVDQRQVQFNVVTEEKRLQVVSLALNRRAPAARGQDSLALLSLELRNSGAGETSSNLLLHRLRLHLLDRDGKPVPPGRLLRGVRLVSAGNPLLVHGSQVISASNQDNPLTLELDNPAVIPVEASHAVTLLADLTSADSVSAFTIGFQHSREVVVKDQDSDSLVAVEDAQGRTGSAFKITSALSVLFDAQLASFYNYPNPFRPGKPPNRGTRFVYSLPQDSDVDLEIYTVLGDLVWRARFRAADPEGKQGNHDGYLLPDVVWEGRNGQNREVLNGVYLAVLKTNSGTVMTKVAVIK